jgi:hypothetical protein
MPRYFVAGGSILFFLASLVQCLAQQNFTINHPGEGTYPNCTGGIACNATQACVSYIETWTLDRSTIFANEMVSDTYQNPWFSACSNNGGTLDEWINFDDPTGITFATGMWYGNDGACPNAFQTNLAH